MGGSHSNLGYDVENEDLSLSRINIKSRDSRIRVEDLRLSLTRRSDHRMGVKKVMLSVQVS